MRNPGTVVFGRSPLLPVITMGGNRTLVLIQTRGQHTIQDYSRDTGHGTNNLPNEVSIICDVH